MVNALALACMSSGYCKKEDALTVLLIRLVFVSGLLGVLPVVLFREELICTCESELCLSNGALCKLNQTSIYVVMAACFCLLLKFASLIMKMAKRAKLETKYESWRMRQLVWAMPLVFALASFGLEEQGNTRFHLAKAGVRCQFRYGSLLEESLLLHIPMCLCVCAMTYVVQATSRLCLQVMMMQCEQRNLRSLLQILATRPQLRKMQQISVLSVFLMIMWISQAVEAGSVFRNHLNSIDAWFRCVRFDFARHAAVGVEWEELLASNIGGDLCPTSPDGVGLFESLLLKDMFEVLLPLLVASNFSVRIIIAAVGQWQKKRKYGSTTSIKPIMPNFDSGTVEDSSSHSTKSTSTTDKETRLVLDLEQAGEGLRVMNSKARKLPSVTRNLDSMGESEFMSCLPSGVAAGSTVLMPGDPPMVEAIRAAREVQRQESSSTKNAFDGQGGV